MSEQQPIGKFFKVYDLGQARGLPSQHTPAPHQNQALQRLQKWFAEKPKPRSGGLLVLPTGGGKTFTAVRFLCQGPLSENYKVLWLAHTHHLLEQAFHGLESSVGHIAEPKRELSARVVSGATGHFPVFRIKPTDDVVVGTVQTLHSAFAKQQKELMEFLDEAQGRLCVVFDEAHHSPAPSYRKFVTKLNERCESMVTLGLTATPRYSDERRAGWLKKLFPQEILYEVSTSELMAAQVLAKPIFEEQRTDVPARFDEREYQKWVGTNRDLPEELISKLAEDRNRNAFIAQTYVNNKERYGKTIIFADRWFQCDFLREHLRTRGVRADVVYSHVAVDRGGADARNKRSKEENARVIEAFRRDELDVLINVRMLTEGTDVPSVQSVFLTRQTTSEILMTQMVGRALRGSKFGGTDSAYIVSFIDSWRQLINWATYDQILDGETGEGTLEYGKRPPLQTISIELVRKLARQMDSGMNIETAPFLLHMPVGWYRVEYYARDRDSDEIEPVNRLVMVFENEQREYRSFVQRLLSEDLEAFSEESTTLASVSSALVALMAPFFTDGDEHLATNLHDDLFSICRHVAQNKSVPEFFSFEERKRHDLDAVAADALENDLSARAVDQILHDEYNRNDRFWATLYHPYQLFKSQFDACTNRLLEAARHGGTPQDYRPPARTPERLPAREPSDAVKRQVKRRDGGRCLCCGEGRARLLQVDHTHPWSLGGSNVLDNLQTLCGVCNRFKGTTVVNFRDPQSDLKQPHDELLRPALPEGKAAGAVDEWQKYLRRTVNVFYRCGAVQSVDIASRGERFRHWVVELGVANDPSWLRSHLGRLLSAIARAKEEAGFGAPESITITAPDVEPVVVRVDEAADLVGVADEVEEALRKKARDADMGDEDFGDEFEVVGLMQDATRVVPLLVRLLREYELEQRDAVEVAQLLAERFPAIGSDVWEELERRLAVES